MSIQFLPSPAENAWAFEQLGLPESATPQEIDATYFRLLAANQFVPYDEVQEAYEILKGRQASAGFRHYEMQSAEQQVEDFAAEMAKMKPARKQLRFNALQKSIPPQSRAAARLQAMAPAVEGAFQRFQFNNAAKQKLGDACVKALSMRPIDRLLLADEMRADPAFPLERTAMEEAAASLYEKQRGLTDSVSDFLHALFRTDEPIAAYQPQPTLTQQPPLRGGRNIPYRYGRQPSQLTPGVIGLCVVALIIGVGCIAGMLGSSSKPSRPKINYEVPSPYRYDRSDFEVDIDGEFDYGFDPSTITREEAEKWAEKMARERYEGYNPYESIDEERRNSYEKLIQEQNERMKKLYDPDSNPAQPAPFPPDR